MILLDKHLEGGREAAVGWVLTLGSYYFFQAGWGSTFREIPGESRQEKKAIGGRQEKWVSQKGRTKSRSQYDVMGQARALEPERLVKFQLHHFLCGFAQIT